MWGLIALIKLCGACRTGTSSKEVNKTASKKWEHFLGRKDQEKTLGGWRQKNSVLGRKMGKLGSRQHSKLCKFQGLTKTWATFSGSFMMSLAFHLPLEFRLIEYMHKGLLVCHRTRERIQEANMYLLSQQFFLLLKQDKIIFNLWWVRLTSPPSLGTGLNVYDRVGEREKNRDFFSWSFYDKHH